MSASFGFGSFGDIITTVQLVWRLSQALSDSRGSAHEFRELIVELDMFHRALDELLRFWQSRCQSAELDRLADILKPTVADCHQAIESFFEGQFKRYIGSFSRPKGSRKNISDVFKRIRWSVLEKEKVTQLRDKLQRNKNLVDIVQASALSIAQDQNHDLIAARLESLTNAEAEAADQLNKQFGQVLGHLKAHATIAANTDKNVVAVLSELRTANSHISSVQAEIASLPRVYASLDPYRHNTVFIEDALGSTIPVPLDINPSWETIQSMVRDQFKHRPGQELVMSKKYVLHDIVTGTDLDSKAEFHQSVRPGHKVAMAMIFGGMWLKGNDAGVESSCPKCSQKLPFDTPGSDTICPNNQCNFIFRRVLDISAWDNDAVDEWVSHPKAAQSPTRNFGYEDLSELIAKRETLDGPNIFKRVRYISRWEDLEDSRGNLTATIDGIRFWGFGSNGWADQAFWNILTLTAVELAWRDWRGHRPGPDTSLDAYVIVLTVRFAGYTKSTSVPIITVLVKHQRYRQRVQDAMRSLEFIRAGRIQVLVAKYESSSDPLFPENIANPPAFEEAVKARRKREGFGL